jgi:hypothetical protein
MIELFASVVDSPSIERALREVVVEDVTRDRIRVFPRLRAGGALWLATGASFAISLLMNSARNVALIDKARFPRDKACGDGIGPGAVQILKKLGLGD